MRLDSSAGPDRSTSHRSLLHRSAPLATLLALALALSHAPPALAQHQQHGLPLVVSADNSTVQGFVRIINRSARAGTVRIHAVDDAGRRFGPISLAIGADATVHFNSGDLESGNAAKGLPGGVGAGTGDWRLELATSLDIEPLAYIRTSDGFLTSIHDIVPGEFVPGSEESGSVDDSVQHHVRFFNPASNRNQISRLRVINTAGVDNTVVIRGVDDRGRPGEGEVSFTLPPYGARTVSAQALEEGAASAAIPSVRPQHGRLGDGAGKWQLFVSSRVRGFGRPLQVMSLLFSRPSGNLANLSAVGAGNDPTRGGPGTDWLSGGAGDDVINPGDNDDEYDWVLGSPGNDRIVYTDSGASAYQALSYVDLGSGVEATVDGGANRATVTKGSAGTDTIVDVANPLNAGREAPWGGFGLSGTHHADSFDLRLADGQWMEVRGGAGADTIHIRSGRVKVNYRRVPGAVDVDLGAGRANDDGYGSADTFIGDVSEVEGGPHGDTLRGSDGGEGLNGGPGNDVLIPRDGDYNVANGDDWIRGSTGDDRIVYTESGGPRAWQRLDYDRLDQGITVTIDGGANRGTVNKGAAGTDTIVDVATLLNGGNFGLEGTHSGDVFNLTVGGGQWMQVRGNAGNDTFNFRGGGGTARLDYRNAPAGVDVDLGAGRASDDGWGDVDTINGHVRDFRGSNFNDVIRGSDNDESFIGRGGDDVIDGGGGFDRLRFDRSGVGAVEVDLLNGTATGTWDGRAFSYRISNIERVDGSRNGGDRLYGSNGDNRLQGGGGDDFLDGREGNDRLEGGDGNDVLVGHGGADRPEQLRGGAGNDTFIIGGDGTNTIEDFTNGEDLINLNVYGISSHSDVLAATSLAPDGNGVWIDLSRYGGEGVYLWQYFDIDGLDASDFLL